MHNQFKIKDLGKLHYFLGLEMLYKADGVLVCRRKFTMDLLKEYDCLTYSSVSSPRDFTIKLRSGDGALLSNPGYYRKLVGYLKKDLTLGIFLSNDPNYIVSAYCDSDWAVCPDLRNL
ncbi:uncharacterized mitochondrial protein AtMg00810-like [Nicotiana sylvestris]|uniref:uncharacterized mitochondrial protein AtMg00810-like n=1 Tax=Nicotiana sylvestris TaxID=4096 RepID=UPI00388C43A9